MVFVALKLVKDSSEPLFQMLLSRNSLITKEHLILVRPSTESSLKGICFNRILQLLLGCQNTLNWKNSRSVSECRKKNLVYFSFSGGFHSISFHPILTWNITHCDNISYYEREREGDGERERKRSEYVHFQSFSDTENVCVVGTGVSAHFHMHWQISVNLLFCTVCVNDGLKDLCMTLILSVNCTFLEQGEHKQHGER